MAVEKFVYSVVKFAELYFLGKLTGIFTNLKFFKWNVWNFIEEGSFKVQDLEENKSDQRKK